MKNGLVFLLFFALIMGVSCEKESTPRNANEGRPLITREIFSADMYVEYIYNEQNLLKEKKSKWLYNVYKYSGDGRLTSIDRYEDMGIYSDNSEIAQASMHRTEWVSPENTQKTTINSYNYENLIPESLTVLEIPSGIQHRSSFQCDDQGSIVNQVYYSEDTIAGRIVYSYDIWGNVSKEEHYIDGKLLYMRLFEYDKKHNPFNVFRQLLMPGIYTNENNIISESLKMAFNDDPTLVLVQVTKSVYEYNNQDYPVLKNGEIRYEYK